MLEKFLPNYSKQKKTKQNQKKKKKDYLETKDNVTHTLFFFFSIINIIEF